VLRLRTGKVEVKVKVERQEGRGKREELRGKRQEVGG
jgi:hypothetical protein